MASEDQVNVALVGAEGLMGGYTGETVSAGPAGPDGRLRAAPRVHSRRAGSSASSNAQNLQINVTAQVVDTASFHETIKHLQLTFAVSKSGLSSSLFNNT